jgi:hypothetical protein
VLVERRAQGGMVVHAQVAPEPEEGGHGPEGTDDEGARLAAPRATRPRARV